MTSRTVTGRWILPDGTPASGHIWFTPNVRLFDQAAQHVILPEAVQAVLDPAGSISTALPCTDELEPAGWLWEAEECLDQVAPEHQRSWLFTLPQGDGTPVDVVAIQSRDPLVPGPVQAGPRGKQGKKGDPGAGIPDTTGSSEGDVLQLFGPTLTPAWSGNLTAYGQRIDNNDARLDNLEELHGVGTGSPEGKIAAPPGATWVQTDATGGVLVWRKTTPATAATGWKLTEGDTGVQPLTVAKPPAGCTINSLTVSRIGALVDVALDITTTDAVVASADLATLPAGYRPPSSRYGVGGSSPATPTGMLVTNAGLVRVGWADATAVRRYVSVSFRTSNPWPTAH